jgi:hypothetical protein
MVALQGLPWMTGDLLGALVHQAGQLAVGLGSIRSQEQWQAITPAPTVGAVRQESGLWPAAAHPSSSGGLGTPQRVRLLGSAMGSAMLPGVSTALSGGVPRQAGGISEAAFAAAAGAALQRAGGRWEPGTLSERERQCKAFSEWMGQLPSSQQVGWDSCTPLHLMAYMEAEWLPTRGTRALEDGTVGTSAGYMQTTVSHLSTTFKLLGRAAPWGTQADGLCNPVDSEAVKAYLGAYRKQYARAGHETAAARPWKLEELAEALQRMDAAMPPAVGTGLQRALLMRDQAALCFLADCGKRGKDCGRLQVSDFCSSRTGCALSPSAFPLSEGDVWECRMFSKTRQVERGPCIAFCYTGREPACRTNFLWRLEAYLAERARVGAPLGRFLFSPEARSKGAFQDAPLSSQALQGRVREHLRRAGMDHSTLHGLRRALRQDLATAGVEQAEAMRALDIRSRRTDDLYADSSRPVRASGEK